MIFYTNISLKPKDESYCMDNTQALFVFEIVHNTLFLFMVT